MQKNYDRNPRTVAHYLSLTLAILLSIFNGYLQLQVFPLYDDEPAVAVSKEQYLLPGGMTFGVKMETDGVLVVGFSKSSASEKSPAEGAGILRGDVIKSLEGKAVYTASELIDHIENSQGRAMTVELYRDGKTEYKQLTAKLDPDGKYRAGLRVRDGTAGIGTITAIDPETMTFVGLGHGICDSDTGVLMPLRRGGIFDVSVSSVQKGAQGAPGEIKGYFSSNECGVLLKNTPFGVAGKMSGKCFDDITPMAIASRDEVTPGKATILCTLEDNVRREYEISLIKLTSPDGKDKNFVIEVTDEALLQATGGIVQGMSGSPILQNGKIIGAITHVMVNEPTKGYGIFIENMISATSFYE